MAETNERALLPAGMADWLPPAADHEADAVETLIAAFRRWGYDRVKPPLLEFEDSLLAGPGQAVADNTFRLMDPVSQRMMGLRADVTVQVARVATTRLHGKPRPLRLAYAGQVMRVRGSQLRPSRQFGQVGAELIGPDHAEADAEAIVLAARSLRQLGIKELSIDLGLPTLVPALGRSFGLSAGIMEKLQAALDRKDAVAVQDLGNELGADALECMATLLTAVGPADTTVERLASLPLSSDAARERDRLADVVALVRAAEPTLSLTLDPVERRGLEYHTGVTFAVYAPGARGELGRGGRYRAGSADNATDQNQEGEAATGLSFYMDTVLQVAPMKPVAPRIFAPFGSDTTVVDALRAEGHSVIAGFPSPNEPQSDAHVLGCAERLEGDQRVPVSTAQTPTAEENN